MNDLHSVSPSGTLPTRVLVTGAGGLVGRAVVDAFKSSGVQVNAVFRTRTTEDAESLALDLATSGDSLLASVINPPEVIVHLAAAVPHWPRYPDNDDSANATRTMDAVILRAAVSWNARVIYTSTCGLYNPRDSSWKTEEAPIVVRSPYFGAKLDGESAVLAAGGIVLRLSAPYGVGMSLNLVLPRFIKCALAGGAVPIWGSGRREQDFIDVTDVAQAVLATARTGGQGVFNVAAGRPTTMAELAQLVVRILGKGVPEPTGKPDLQDGWTARYCINKARQRLSWSPTSDLMGGISKLTSELNQ